MFDAIWPTTNPLVVFTVGTLLSGFLGWSGSWDAKANAQHGVEKDQCLHSCEMALESAKMLRNVIQVISK